ncbi:MAG: FG-GAP repeat domain-containing protein [Myxococcales bacterium]
MGFIATVLCGGCVASSIPDGGGYQFACSHQFPQCPDGQACELGSGLCVPITASTGGVSSGGTVPASNGGSTAAGSSGASTGESVGSTGSGSTGESVGSTGSGSSGSGSSIATSGGSTSSGSTGAASSSAGSSSAGSTSSGGSSSSGTSGGISGSGGSTGAGSTGGTSTGSGGSTGCTLFGTPYPIQVASPSPGTALTVSVGDLNGDGWPDVAVADQADARLEQLLSVFSPSGGLALTDGGVFNAPSAPTAVAVLSDGRTAVYVDPSGQLYEWQGASVGVLPSSGGVFPPPVLLGFGRPAHYSGTEALTSPAFYSLSSGNRCFAWAMTGGPAWTQNYTSDCPSGSVPGRALAAIDVDGGLAWLATAFPSCNKIELLPAFSSGTYGTTLTAVGLPQALVTGYFASSVGSSLAVAQSTYVQIFPLWPGPPDGGVDPSTHYLVSVTPIAGQSLAAGQFYQSTGCNDDLAIATPLDGGTGIEILRGSCDGGLLGPPLLAATVPAAVTGILSGGLNWNQGNGERGAGDLVLADPADGEIWIVPNTLVCQ